MFEVVVVTMKKLKEISRRSQPKANSWDRLGNTIPPICSYHLNPIKLEGIKEENHTGQGPKCRLYTSARLAESTLCFLLVHILL